MTNSIMLLRPSRLMDDERARIAPVPAAVAPDRLAARAVARHPEQGRSLLCHGVVMSGDGGQLLCWCRDEAAGGSSYMRQIED